MDFHSNRTPATATQRSRKDAQIAQPWRRDSTQPPRKNTTSNSRSFNTPPVGKKAQMSLPWTQNDPQLSRKELATPLKLPNAVDIYYLDGDTKTFLGVAKDKALLARFSTTAGHQHRGTAENTSGTQHEVVLGPLDHAAGLLVLRWINKNNVHVPRPLIYDMPAKFTFDLYCKVHHATQVFRVRRELRGSRVRELLVEHIGSLQHPSFGDFKLAEEQLKFDPPLIYLMRSQVLSVHLVSGLAEGDYDRIVQYCATKGMRLLEEMDAIETEIREGLWGKQSGQETQATPFAVNKSVEDETFVASLSKKSTASIVKREKVLLGFRKVDEKKSEGAKGVELSPSQAANIKKGKVSYADALKF
jgi:hypothetical protein